MANKKKTKRTKRKAGKKFYSAFLLFISVTLVFVFMSFTSNFASNNQNSLWAQLMEAFLKGDDAKKESLLQKIRESEAEAALKGNTSNSGVRQGTTAVPPAGQSATTAANWRDYDWSRFGITNPAYSGRKNNGNDSYSNQREVETETLPTVVYEDWDPYNYQGLYEETKKSKVLTPRFETSYAFTGSGEDNSAMSESIDYDWSTFDWSSIYNETKKSDILRPTYETTTAKARTWQDWFRPTASETTQEVYNVPKETTKSNILFSIFGIGGNKKEDTTETLEAETIAQDEGELVISGSLIKETKEKSRVIDNQINETTRIITTTPVARTDVAGESVARIETSASAVLKPVFETRARETTSFSYANNSDYQEVISGSLIKETSVKSRILENRVTEAATIRGQETRRAESQQVYYETGAVETTASAVLKPKFETRARETTVAYVSNSDYQEVITGSLIKETSEKSRVLEGRVTEAITDTNSRPAASSYVSNSDYQEVITGSLIKETSVRSRVLDKTVTQTSAQITQYSQTTAAEETKSTTAQYVEETTKSNILFSLFGIGRRNETTSDSTRQAQTTTAEQTYETTKKSKPSGVLFPIFNNKRNDETQVSETASVSSETEYDGEEIVTGSIFGETKRKARIIDKSSDRYQATTQYETTALLRETTFDSRPFEVKWPISLIGAGGWYFLKNVSIFDLDAANGKIPESYNKQLVDKLEKCRKLLGKSKKNFALLLCPDKSAIYKEFYPSGTPYPNEASKIKSFIDYAKAHSELSVIYPDRALSFVKNVCDVYYKQDSHWNRIAGYIATRELFEMMGINYTLGSIMSQEIVTSKKLYPGDLYDDGTDLEYDLKGITDSSYVNKADYSGVNFSNDKAPMHISAQVPVDNRSALVIRDSFVANMLPALGPQFRETSLYHIENYTSITKQALQKDVIIIEVTARNFLSLYNLADYLISILEG